MNHFLSDTITRALHVAVHQGAEAAGKHPVGAVSGAAVGLAVGAATMGAPGIFGGLLIGAALGAFVAKAIKNG